MNKPKYLLALDLREQGFSWAEIASRLEIKPHRVKDYLYKARHLERKLALHREHNRRYYAKHKDEINAKKGRYWRDNIDKMRRERLGTVINGRRVTFYHLNKRSRPATCELCYKLRERLYYHHWDGSDLNKGMWLCGGCHRFVTRVERGDIEIYETIKSKIEADICSRVEEKEGLDRLKGDS